MSETDEVKLKDCPFCGAPARLVFSDAAECTAYCLGGGSIRVDLWNRRVWEAEDQKIADAILSGSPRLTEEQREAIQYAVENIEARAKLSGNLMGKQGSLEAMTGLLKKSAVLRSLLSSDKEGE